MLNIFVYFSKPCLEANLVPSLSFHTFRKPGTNPSWIPLCVNWWGLNDGVGYISTHLIGNGRGRLNYGLCACSSSTSAKVTVYLNGNEISSIFGSTNGGSVLEASKDVEFDYSDSDVLKIEGTGTLVFQFNNFTELGCNSKWLHKTFN